MSQAYEREVPTSDVRPRLVVFWSGRSGPCRRAEGYLAQVLQRGQNHQTFGVVRIDADSRPELMERFRVSRLPTLIVVEGKRIRGRLETPRGGSEIEAFLRPWLRRPGSSPSGAGSASDGRPQLAAI